MTWLLLLLLLGVAHCNDVNRARIMRQALMNSQSLSLLNSQSMLNSQSLLASQSLLDSAEDVAAYYFTQTLDHFAPLDSQEYFQQRYYVNQSWWQAGGPAFLIIGGESAMRASSVTGGAVLDMAQEHGAIVFALEHRFYGNSTPTDTLDTDALSYLNSQQALSDLVNFRAAMIQLYNISETTQWAIFGCSYSGSLSAWFRLKFPALAIASFSGSSPVEAVLSFYHYDQVVANSLGTTCTSAIRNATAEMEYLLFYNQTSNDEIRQRLSCSDVTDPVAVLYVLADTVAMVVQYNMGIQKMCDDFINSENLVDTYVTFVNNLFNSTGSTCKSFDISSFTNETYDPNDMMRQWMWQSCDEFGYFQTAPAENSLRSTLINAAWHIQVCKTLFGNSSQGPKIAWTNTFYGGNNSLITSNTIFTNGNLDPWQVLSVTTSLSASVPAIMVDNVAHCANWKAPSPSDPSGLVQARELVSSYLGAFLDACGGGCGDKGLCTYTKSGNSVAATCSCLDGYSGSSCGKAPIPWWSLLILAIGVAAVVGAIAYFAGVRIGKAKAYNRIG